MAPLLTPYLIKKRTELVSKYVNGDILDIGCGDAHILGLLNKNTFYVGIDLEKKMEKIVLEKAFKNQIDAHFYQLNIETQELPKLNHKFDTITMIAVIEHLEKPNDLLIELSKYLKDNGKLIITTPHPIAETIHTFGSKVGIFSREAAEDHKKLYDYNFIDTLLKSTGYKITEYHKFEFRLNQLFCAKLGNEVEDMMIYK